MGTIVADSWFFAYRTVKDNVALCLTAGEPDVAVIFARSPRRLTAPEVATMLTNHKLDLAVLSTQGLTLYPGNGDGTFGSPSTVSANAGGMVAADFNSDGKLGVAPEGPP
jgi:hypothetical protein